MDVEPIIGAGGESGLALRVLMFLGEHSVGVFVVLFGCCVGSLINVLVYRMPRGLGVVTPPSRCPSCETRLTWRENIPVLGWLMLRGRCRFCRSKISAEYPIVEAVTGVLFALVYVAWYAMPSGTELWGLRIGLIRPEYARAGIGSTWPEFVVMLTLVGMLVAVTLVDAKTSMIPLEIPWFATAVAFVLHTGHAAYLSADGIESMLMTAPGFRWAIPTTGAWWTGASIAAVAGIGVSLGLIKAGLIRRSFADYDEWERGALEAQKEAGAGSGMETEGGTPEMWIKYPHARREMVREMAFLAPIVAMGLGGGWVGNRIWGAAGAMDMALWASVVGGVLTGYLVGAGAVWLVRVLGSLAFGKEAMGMGDVHLMGAVGACLGWIDPLLCFWIFAPMVGIVLAVGLGVVDWFESRRVRKGANEGELVVGSEDGEGGKREGSGKEGLDADTSETAGQSGGLGLRRAMPYGPSLAVGTLVVLAAKPWIEQGLTMLLKVQPGEMPINIP